MGILVAVLLDGITVRYHSGTALETLTLRAQDGEALALLGPSGSGKTTVLRAIAGFEEPVRGDVLFDERRMNDVWPAKRNLGLVTQEQVFFPFRDVRGNVAYPLRARRYPEEEISSRVLAEARALGIDHLLDRDPEDLSAGEQQLAQVARAMVRRPDVFLIDEPFSRLDPLGTGRLRGELRMIQQGYGVTTFYATHDYEDAMALADRIVIMDSGRIRQVGTPKEIYHRPVDVFVATFVGSPPMAMLRAAPGEEGPRLGEVRLAVPEPVGTEVTVGVRPESWKMVDNGLSARVERVYTVGADSFMRVVSEAGDAVVRVRGPVPAEGSRIGLEPKSYHLFDPRSGRALFHCRGP